MMIFYSHTVKRKSSVTGSCHEVPVSTGSSVLITNCNFLVNCCSVIGLYFTCVDKDMRGEETDLLSSVQGKDNEDETGRNST